MGTPDFFYNKFEVPLTTVDTEQIIANCSDTNSALSPLIKEVYLPVHLDDGTSGRPFWYHYSREDYYALIKRLLEHKPIVITYPHGEPKIMRRYIALGVTKFMVSRWKPQYAALKKKYPPLRIYRSIVANAYSDSIDTRFDGMVVPYHKLLDVQWLQQASRKTSLIGIINHNCKVTCTNLNNHPKKETVNTKAVELTCFQCPTGRNFFLPRQVVRNILPYLSALKLVERLQYCFEYEKFIKYYIGEELLDEGFMGHDVVSHIKFYEGSIVHKLYSHSHLVSLNCQFKCAVCDKKCF